MSVTDQIVRESFNCNNAVVDFSFAHPFMEISDLDVWHIDADDTPTPLDHVTDYNYDLPTGDPMDGCTITTVATYATGEKIMVIRDIPYTQPTNWGVYSKFMPSQINTDLDRMAMEIQQLKEKLDRVPSLNVISAISGIEIDEPVENYFLLWKSGALRSRQFLSPGSLSFEAFMEVFLEANTKELARAAIDAAVDTHNHNLADLSEKDFTSLVDKNLADMDEKSYNSLTDKPDTVPVGLEGFCPKETPPAGWLEEDGKTLGNTGSGADYAGDQYKNLYDYLEDMYGGTYNWDNDDVVNLPDPRGRTIRAWDHGAGVDPDAATRTDRGDGITGDHVGTKQADAMQGHKHSSSPAFGVTPSGGLVGVGGNGVTTLAVGSPTTDGVNGAPRTTSESRGKNVNRMMIIKY